MLRAGLHVVFSGGEKTQGASTITQQVARNFFLSSEKSYTRKLSEMFLARRIEQALTKDEILELYLNKIFLGNRAYGVAAAAEFYYGKTLDQLTLSRKRDARIAAEIPVDRQPVEQPRARDRAPQLRAAAHAREQFHHRGAVQGRPAAEPDLSYAHEPPIEVEAPYLAEMVRRDALERLGNDALTDGYTIRTTLDSRAAGCREPGAARRPDQLRPASWLSRPGSTCRTVRAVRRRPISTSSSMPITRSSA